MHPVRLQQLELVFDAQGNTRAVSNHLNRLFVAIRLLKINDAGKVDGLSLTTVVLFHTLFNMPHQWLEVH